MPTIVFSCEIGAREFVPRLALGLLLQKKGYDIIIGHKFSTQKILERYKSHGINGLFIHKDANTDSIKYHVTAAAAGLLTAATDEESLNWDKFHELEFVANVRALPYVGHLFASSAGTLDAASKVGFNAVPAGNLRLGLAQRLYNQRPLRPNSNILVNSPGGFLFTYNLPIQHLEISSRLANSDWLTHFLKMRELIKLELDLYKDIVDKVDLFIQDGLSVTVRSHPTDAEEFWQMLLAGKRVHVQSARENSILSMINYSDIYAYDCTTLIEGYVLRKRLFNLSRGENIFGSTLTNIYLKGQTDPGFRSPSLDRTLFLDGNDIFDNWVNELSRICPSESRDVQITINESDRVVSMPRDVALRKGSVSVQTLKNLLKFFGNELSSIQSFQGDLFYLRGIS
jgi:surface carbohydrate biosynthesis protein